MNSFKYITLNDMNTVIRDSVSIIPHDVDFVIGVPRSGMICGSVISEFLNVPLIDVDSFIEGNSPSGGNRLKLFKEKDKTNRILVVDDTVCSGVSIKKVQDKLSPFKDKYTFIYMCIFIDGPGENYVNLYLSDLRKYTKRDIQPIYEWNLFNHYPHIISRFCFDFDGVFCAEEGRPDDRNEKEYEEYIRNAKPLFIPKVPISCIVTYRIKKYKDVSEEWLNKNGITCRNMVMVNADSADERNSKFRSELMKGEFYKNHPEFLLFVESDDYQARVIHEISKKQVLCVNTNRMYGDIYLP